MNADLNNTFKYDKIVININNHNCITPNVDESNFYVDLVEPIKNIIYIKILRATITTNDNSMKSAPLSYIKYEPIYIAINDFHRSVSYIKNSNNFDQVNYFDLIQYSDISGTGGISYSDVSYGQTSFDWTDSSVYILNPPEQSLKRLNIQFRDKTFKPFNTTVLTHFNISICIYFIKNRV